MAGLLFGTSKPAFFLPTTLSRRASSSWETWTEYVRKEQKLGIDEEIVREHLATVSELRFGEQKTTF